MEIYENYKIDLVELDDAIEKYTNEDANSDAFMCIVAHFFENDIKCVNIRSNICYVFNGHRWEENNVSIFPHIIFKGMIELLSQKKILINDNTDNFCIVYKKIYTIQKLLKLSCYDVFRSLLKKIYDSDFLNTVDNKNYIVFNNCLFDLRNKLFRVGTRNENIRFSVGYDFINFDENHENIVEMKQILRDYFNDDYELSTKSIATFLLNNKNNKTLFLTGPIEGGTGKSIFMKFLLCAFANYCEFIDIACMNFPHTLNAFNTFNMKKQLRYIISDLTTYDSDHKMKKLPNLNEQKFIFVCDNVHSNTFEMYKQRTTIINFPNNFYKNDKREEWKIMKEKIHKLTPAFMWLLLKYYQEDTQIEPSNNPIKTEYRTIKQNY